MNEIIAYVKDITQDVENLSEKRWLCTAVRSHTRRAFPKVDQALIIAAIRSVCGW